MALKNKMEFKIHYFMIVHPAKVIILLKNAKLL